MLEGPEGTANETCFQRGKEILSLLLGVFGTFVGFYFGSEVSSKAKGQGVVQLLPLRLSVPEVSAGASLTITSAATAGTPPYRFGTAIGDDADVERKVPADESGWISQDLHIPPNASGDNVILRMEVEDAVGAVAQRVTKIPLKAQQSH